MASVRVGVERIGKQGFPVEPAEEAHVAIRVHWVEIDGLRLDSERFGITSVDWHGDAGAHDLMIHLVCGDFATVDHREPAPELPHSGWQST